MKSAGPSAQRVWDPFVRLFHWSLVTCVALNLWVVEEGEAWHEWLGYATVALVGARIVWGWVGTRHARFSDFWPTPTRVVAHLQALWRGERPDHPGHNPLGALMMLTLMGLVLALGLSGWLQTTDTFWGVDWVQELHESLAEGLQAMVLLHAAAALIMGRFERTRLVKAMITGVKEHY